MYLDYETYQALGGQVSEADFPASEAWAEAVLDQWTLGRLRSVDWDPWAGQVRQVMARLVDGRESIEAAEGGQALSSFSNGQDSYTFADPEGNAALLAVARLAWRVLPVELVSACVRYNGACREG